MSFEAKLKRGFVVATLTTEQLRDTNIYAEKPHTQMHMYWVTWFHKKKKSYIDMEKQDTRPHSRVPLQECISTGTKRFPLLQGRRGINAKTHTHTDGGSRADPLVCPHMAAIDR